MKLRGIILAAVILALAATSCGIYSFTGTSIQPDVHSVTINYFEYKALKVNPSLANDLTEGLKTQFKKMTRLEQVDMDGDLEIEGSVTGYSVSATAVTSNEVAAQNRLTIGVSIKFTNRLHPEEDLEKSFSQYADYDSNQSLESVESSLCAEIVDKLIEDIINATIAQW